MSKVRSAPKVTAPAPSGNAKVAAVVQPSEVDITSLAHDITTPPKVPLNFNVAGNVQPPGKTVSGYVFSWPSGPKSDVATDTDTAGGSWVLTFNLAADFPAGLAKMKAFIDDATVEPASDAVWVTVSP
jgi:hypothetical protein